MKQKTSPMLFLLTDSSRDPWVDSLRESLAKIKIELRLIQSQEVFHGRLIEPIDTVFIDSSSVSKTVKIVELLRQRSNETKIIVITSVLNWKQARDVLKAQANEYLFKTNDIERFLEEAGLDVEIQTDRDPEPED